MSYRTGDHTKFYQRFHVVWVTKYRYKVLRGTMRERLREFIRQTCDELGVQIIKGVLSTDHVHMFLSIPPHLALSTVMQRTGAFILPYPNGVSGSAKAVLGQAVSGASILFEHVRKRH